MKRRRPTIARWMGLTALLAANAALIRAFFVQEMFCGGILIFMALQVGLARLLRGRGRSRRFWWGFEAFGTAAVLSLFSCELFPDSPLNRMLMSFVNNAADLAFQHLPTALSDPIDEHSELFLAAVYFAPELVAALLGGTLAACLFREGLTPAHTALPKASGVA